MKTNHIITLNIFITLLLLGGFYYAINTYGTQFLTGVWDKNGVTKIINQKVIQENVSEYRKISDMQSDVTEAIAKVSPAVVHIVRTAGITATTGSSFMYSLDGGGSAMIVTSDGYLLTNKHVVENVKDKYAAITSEGERLPVTNIWLDPVLDLAILKISGPTGQRVTDLPTVSFVSADSLINMGQFAISLGSSQSSMQFIQSLGTVSQKNIDSYTSGDSSLQVHYYGVDSSIYPGFSGGPTIDLQGNVIAITTAMNNGNQKGGQILPVTKEMIEATLDSITKNGTIERPAFGITAMSLNAYVAKQLGLKKFAGWYIERVTAGSPAAEMGLMRGDIITQVAGKDITDDMPFSRYRLGYSSGETLDLTVYSKDTTQKLSITLK